MIHNSFTISHCNANTNFSLRVLLAVILFSCGIHRITATQGCCFVRWNTGNAVQHNQQLHQLYHPHVTLKQIRSMKQLCLSLTPTNDMIQKQTLTRMMNRFTPRFHYLPYIDRYPPRSQFVTTAIGSTLKPSMSISSTAIEALATVITGTSSGIIDTSKIIVGLSRTTITTSITVAVTLLISAFCGLLVEQQKETDIRIDCRRFLPPSILVALVSSTTIAYMLRKLLLFQLPQQHFIYDICWSTLLPSSLTFLLFSLPSSSSKKTKHQSTLNSTTSVATSSDIVEVTQQHSSFAAIGRLAIPFLIASIGSIIGCFISFLLCYFNPKQLLSVADARQAAACLCASFIGGSINFFATSVIIQQDNIRNNSGNNHALLSAMAAVDIVVMAIYFTLLSAALQSHRLHRWFTSSNKASDIETEAFATEEYADTIAFTAVNKIEKLKYDKHKISKGTNTSILLPAVLSIGVINMVLVETSKRMEVIIMKHFGVPGTACAFLAIIVPWISTQINYVFFQNSLWNAMQKCAEPMSRWAFLMVFATMGCTADLSTALYNGPACLLVSFSALIVHGIVTLFGSYIFRRLFARTQIDLTDVLVASNAAIGGPATAAAFCGEIKKTRNPIRRRNITIAATVWGVVGYAIGTTIGVTMFRTLQSFL